MNKIHEPCSLYRKYNCTYPVKLLEDYSYSGKYCLEEGVCCEDCKYLKESK